MNIPSSPNLDDLRVFCTVARKSSFSAAAEVLSVSAAYVSKRVSVLETDLGTRLLHRSTRRVAITEAGERVYAWAEKSSTTSIISWKTCPLRAAFRAARCVFPAALVLGGILWPRRWRGSPTNIRN